jgi:hypothetical protein
MSVFCMGFLDVCDDLAIGMTTVLSNPNYSAPRRKRRMWQPASADYRHNDRRGRQARVGGRDELAELAQHILEAIIYLADLLYLVYCRVTWPPAGVILEAKESPSLVIYVRNLRGSVNSDSI